MILAEDLGLQPPSEDEGVVDDDRDPPTEIEVSNDESEEEPESPVVLKTFKVLQRPHVSSFNVGSTTHDRTDLSRRSGGVHGFKQLNTR